MTTLNYKQLISLPEYFGYGLVIIIDISHCNLKSLTELNLRRFYNLQELNCSYNKLQNLDGLSKCTSLRKLYCRRNQIENLSGLSNCTSLLFLDCCDNELENLDGLYNCTSLEDLNCGINKINNIDGLSNCTSLKSLECYRNELTDLDELYRFTSLRTLDCGNNHIKFSPPIKILKNLDYFNYFGNPFEKFISDIEEDIKKSIENPHNFPNLKMINKNETVNDTHSKKQKEHDLTKINNISTIKLINTNSNLFKDKEQKILNRLHDLDLKFSRIQHDVCTIKSITIFFLLVSISHTIVRICFKN